MKLHKILTIAFAGILAASNVFAAAQSSYTTKSSPVSGDKALITDSEDSNKTKQATIGSMKDALGLGTGDNPSFNSVHASGGNLAAANAQVTKKWITGLSYTADVTSVIHGGEHYIAKTTHTAGSTTEPGVGADWETAWYPPASGSGDNLGSATYSNVVALWALGACSGYLKSDGSCDTPSGSATYPGSAGVANWDGSAWGTSYTVGTSANNLVQLNSSAQLPAVSAALLTNFPTLNQNTTGSAATLTTARTIGGVSFNGSANINLPGVNTAGNQNTSGNAGTATALAANGTNCSAGQAALGVDASGNAEGCWTPSGSGDVVGPSSATDTAIALFDSTTGKLLKNSVCTISAAGIISCTVADGSRYATLPNNTSAPSSATVLNGFYTYNNELYGVENSGTASKVLMANDIGVSGGAQAYNQYLPTWPSTVDATEVGYLNNVTSSIQTQLDAKQASLSFTTTGLTAGHPYYMTSGGSWADADANGTSTYPARCVAVSTTSCKSTGFYTATSHGLTVGATIWLSTTAGAYTTTQPSTSGDKVQALGWVVDANTIFINVSPDYGTVQ